jgi:hypothetical protein
LQEGPRARSSRKPVECVVKQPRGAEKGLDEQADTLLVAKRHPTGARITHRYAVLARQGKLYRVGCQLAAPQRPIDSLSREWVKEARGIPHE